jgi:hypothetical protein
MPIPLGPLHRSACAELSHAVLAFISPILVDVRRGA